MFRITSTLVGCENAFLFITKFRHFGGGVS